MVGDDDDGEAVDEFAEKTKVDEMLVLDEDDAIPEDEKTPVPDTGAHSLTPSELAIAADDADRSGYARGREHGIAIGRLDAIDVFRSLWLMFELRPGGPPAPAWEEAKAWVERRLI